MSQYNQKRNSGYNRSKQYVRKSGPKTRGRQIKKAYIHPSKFIQQANPKINDEYIAKHKFEDFIIADVIQNNLRSMQYDSPSPVQDQAIPIGLTGRSVLGIADTGTGKTAAFAIPVLNKLITEPSSKAIIIAPTRELAEQIEQQCRLIGKGSNLDGALLIGGTSMSRQLNDLRFNPRIIIGTPGRIKDHLNRGSLKLNDCNLVVLDEVDRMLDMGFVNDIEFILSTVSANPQSFYFSATLDDRVRKIINRHSQDIELISVKSGSSSSNVDQNIVQHDSSDKLDKLHSILIQEATSKTIVFDDTHRTVEKLSKELIARGFQADAIHGGKSQSQRQRVLNRFKKSEVKVLVATDVAARGLDVSDVTHVVNYSLPQSYDDYVHRIGRTGRAGKVGYALTFIEKGSYNEQSK